MTEIISIEFCTDKQLSYYSELIIAVFVHLFDQEVRCHLVMQ